MKESSLIGRINAYYQLTKPGIIYGNILTTADQQQGSTSLTHTPKASGNGSIEIIPQGCRQATCPVRNMRKKHQRAIAQNRISGTSVVISPAEKETPGSIA